MAERPEIEIVGGPLSGKRFAVPEGGLRLGRSSSNDIHVPDEELSRNHCLFEAVGEDGIRLTDLASANGTTVNGRTLGDAPAVLKAGDVIVAGATTLRVVGTGAAEPPTPPPGPVDLGLGEPGGPLPPPAARRRRSPFANVLWAFGLLAAAAAAYVVLVAPRADAPTGGDAVQAVPEDEDPPVKEVFYEKVEADSERIFRYEMTLSADGALKVVVDNVPGENRHVTKSQQLDAKALAELNGILSYKALRGIDRAYEGVEPDPPALESWTLKVVYATRARTIRIANTQEPEAFRAVREKLETFSKNQLGVWALQYSREKLVALAEESVALGRAKWEDRDVQYGNLFGAVKAYEEALFYLETVNPKPDCAAAARQGLETAQAELAQRYANQRFLADRAINLRQWAEAQRELTVLLEMVPDRGDDRNREAAAKLIDVERRMKGDK